MSQNRISYHELRAGLEESFPNLADEWRIVRSHNNRGNEFAAAKDYESAIACYKDALQSLSYSSAPILAKQLMNNIGHALNAKGCYQEAIECFNRIRSEFDLDEDDAEIDVNVLSELGFAYQSLGNYRQAVKYFKMAKHYDHPECNDYIQNKLDELSEYDIEWLSKQIERCEESESYEEALYYYGKYLELNPKDYNSWNNCASIFNKQQLYGYASKSADKAIELDPTIPNAWRHLGNACMGMKLYQAALDKYREAVHLKPDYQEAWVNLGELYFIENKYNEAIEAFHQALAIDSSLISATDGIKKTISVGTDINFEKILIDAARMGVESSVLLALLHDRNLLDTLDSAQQTPLYYAAYNGQVNCVRLLLEFKANVNHADSIGNTAIHHAAMSHSSPLKVSAADAKECIRLLMQYGGNINALTQNQKTAHQMAKEGGKRYSSVTTFIYGEMRKIAQIIFNEADKLGEAGNHLAAIRKYEEGLKITPDDVVAWNNKAYERNQLGQYKSAIFCCKRAIELDQQYANPWRHRGNAHFGLQEYENAIQCYNTALRLQPNYPKAQADKIRCQEILDELATIKSIHNYIKPKIDKYKKSLENNINSATIAGITFFYNKELSDKKQQQADALLSDINVLAKASNAHQLLQEYKKKDQQLALAYDKDPATFSQLLGELTVKVDHLTRRHTI